MSYEYVISRLKKGLDAKNKELSYHDKAVEKIEGSLQAATEARNRTEAEKKEIVEAINLLTATMDDR